MAELDRFEKAIRPGWRGAYRQAREEAASPEEVADKLAQSLVRTLREEGGVPGLPGIEEVFGSAAWQLALPTSSGVLLQAFNDLDQIVRDQGGHRHTRIAVDAAKSLLVQQSAPAQSWPTLAHLAERVCSDLVKHSFFATARDNLVAEGKVENHGQARDWQEGIQGIMQPAIRQIAERLMKDPSAEALRAPSRIVKKQPTSELMGEVLVSDERVASKRER